MPHTRQSHTCSFFKKPSAQDFVTSNGRRVYYTQSQSLSQFYNVLLLQFCYTSCNVVMDKNH